MYNIIIYKRRTLVKTKAGAIHGDIRGEIRRADFAAVFVLSGYTQRIRVTDSLIIFAAIFQIFKNICTIILT